MEYILKKDSSLKRLEWLRSFIEGERWLTILFVIAGTIAAISSYCTPIEQLFFPNIEVDVIGTVILAYITAACLIISRSILGWLTPFMFTYMIAIRCYDSLDAFMDIIWLAPPLVVAVLFHFIVYRKKLNRKGSLFLPMVIVSVSVLLGGIGFISPKEYFGGASLYNMIGIGFGMVIVYCYFNAHIDLKKQPDFIEKFIRLMVVVGLFASFMVILIYVIKINGILDMGRVPSIRWRNNLSTILMITMPFAFFMAHKNSYASFLGFLFFGAMLLSGSRSGMIFGAIELIMCIVMFVLYDKKRRLAYIVICSCIFIGVLIFAPQITSFFTFTIERIFNALNGVLLAEKTETRIAHYARGIEDFLNHPIFGTGLGYMGNRDIFKNKDGALCWYHCAPIQIAGSFGIVGILSFGFQFIKRNLLLWKNRTLFNLTIFLSYISLELMSLVNPGIFCPIPYLMLITMFMVIAEKKNELEIST